MLEDRLIPYFDQERGLRLAEIEPRDVKALAAWLAQQTNPHDPARTLGRSTIGYHVAVLRALFADAVEEGVLRSSPTTGLRVLVPSTDDVDEPAKAMTRAELNRVLDEVGRRWRLFFEFLAHTGLRISEALELRWRDLDLSLVPRLRVRRQLRDGEAVGPRTTAGRRTLPLSPAMADRLRALEGSPDALVFTTTTGRQINRSNLWRDVLHPAASEPECRGSRSTRSAIRARRCCSLPARTSNRYKRGSATPTRASPCGPISTSWTRASAMPASSMTSSGAGVPLRSAMTAKEQLLRAIDDLTEDRGR